MHDYEEWIDSLRAFFSREGFEVEKPYRGATSMMYQLLVTIAPGYTYSIVCGDFIRPNFEVAVLTNGGFLSFGEEGDDVRAGLNHAEVVDMFYELRKKLTNTIKSPREIYSDILKGD